MKRWSRLYRPLAAGLILAAATQGGCMCKPGCPDPRPGEKILDSVPIFASDETVSNGTTAHITIKVDPTSAYEKGHLLQFDDPMLAALYVADQLPIAVWVPAKTDVVTQSVNTIKQSDPMQNDVYLTFTVKDVDGHGTAKGTLTIRK